MCARCERLVAFLLHPALCLCVCHGTDTALLEALRSLARGAGTWDELIDDLIATVK